MTRTARRATLALALLAGLVATAPGAAASTGSTVPSAAAVVAAMDKLEGVSMRDRQDEGPDAVVRDGLCSILAAGGCEKGLISKDATLLVFGRSAQARAYAGAADDAAEAMGRMVISFGSPARMGEKKQAEYVDAARAFRRTHPKAKNSLFGVSQAVMRSGLPMRWAHHDRGETRSGMANRFDGLVVDWMSTRNVDVLVFAKVEYAEGHLGCGDDQAVRRGRVVLSFGNPARLGPAKQKQYAAAFRQAMDDLAAQAAGAGSASCGG
jgi:hypothetical protein